MLVGLCDIDVLYFDFDGENFEELIMFEDVGFLYDVFYWINGNFWVICKGDWKLFGNFKDISGKGLFIDVDGIFFVNLSEDVLEMMNLVE